MSAWSKSEVYYRKLGGVWLRTDQVAAAEIGLSGIDVHLVSGGRVTLDLARTPAALDSVMQAIAKPPTEDVEAEP